MIDKLKKIEKNQLIELLENKKLWLSLDIDYHPPRVERVWCQLDNHRLSLHFIYPCKSEEALFHPHPWPSAMHVIEGVYEMGMGFGAGNEEPPKMGTIEAAAGTYYDMIHIDAWHYVRPIERCASVMLTGKPWSRPSPRSTTPLKSLSDERVEEILQHFLDYYRKGS